MARTVVCVTEAFQKPKALSDLVIFSDPRPQIPAGDLSPYMKYCSMYAKEHQVWLVPHRFVVDNKLYLIDFLVYNLERVDKSGRYNDCSTVLVIVEYGDVADFLKLFLNLKATGCRDVLEVDTAERT